MIHNPITTEASMSNDDLKPDPVQIYLQPECCASPNVARPWCGHGKPERCKHGMPWTQYVRGDVKEEATKATLSAMGNLIETQEAEIDALRSLLADAEASVAEAQTAAINACAEAVRAFMPSAPSKEQP